MTPRPPGAGGTLSHLGLRVSDVSKLEVYRQRLEAAGICTSNQNGTVCSYALQDKLWLRDPDGNFWEIYHIDEHIPPESVRQSLPPAEARMDTPNASRFWEHHITDTLPDRIPCDDDSLEEIRLTGTFNVQVAADDLYTVLRESRRVLKPGGRLVTHGLMSDLPIANQTLDLPGMAALVQRMPVHREVADQIRSVGFTNLEYSKLTARSWFEINGIGLREVKICAYRPLSSESSATHAVLYRGPFARLVTDTAGSFVRGQRVTVNDAVWTTLRQGSAAESFVFFGSESDSSCSAGSSWSTVEKG